MHDLRFEQAAASAIPVLALAVVVGVARYRMSVPAVWRLLLFAELMAFFGMNIAGETGAMLSLYRGHQLAWAPNWIALAMIASVSQLVNTSIVAIAEQNEKDWPGVVALLVSFAVFLVAVYVVLWTQ